MHASTDGCIALPAWRCVRIQARRVSLPAWHSASLASRPMALPLLLHSMLRSSVTWIHAPPHLLLRQMDCLAITIPFKAYASFSVPRTRSEITVLNFTLSRHRKKKIQVSRCNLGTYGPCR